MKNELALLPEEFEGVSDTTGKAIDREGNIYKEVVINDEESFYKLDDKIELKNEELLQLSSR